MIARKHIVYVPGLGDSRAFGQDVGIRLWRLVGFMGHYHAVDWEIDEPWEHKLARLTAHIDRLAADGSVYLMGFSAGASAALNAYAARPDAVAGVLYVSGKIQRPDTVAPRLYARNPAFRGSLESAQANIARLTPADKRKMLTLYPLFDPVVTAQDASIPGVRQLRTVAWSHAMSVAVALTVYAPRLAWYLKRMAVQ